MKGKIPKNIKLFLEKRRFLKKPTKIEKQMIDIIERNNLPFKYVGDNQFFVGIKNPDFININGQKIAIEVRNRKVCQIYDKCSFEEYKQKRIDYFQKFNWKCFVFSENELNPQEIIETIRGV